MGQKVSAKHVVALVLVLLCLMVGCSKSDTDIISASPENGLAEHAAANKAGQVQSQGEGINVRKLEISAPEKIVEELETLNKRSFEMALSVHKAPALRAQLSHEASLLQERLLDIAKELERIAPDEHKQWFFRISESMLDFDFVIADKDITSLRLGDIIRWGK
jgi:hypothetical protein